MNCKKAKQIDLVYYLKKQGFKTGKTDTKDVWFYSPFKEEITPSFKVNITKNVFFDHSSGIGGTIIDFVMKYNNCSIKEALEKLSNDSFSFHQQPKMIKKKSTYSILKVVELENKQLISYIEKRKINLEFAKRFCFQVHYAFDSKKEYYGIGFMNDYGGFEIRNNSFKGCLNKKAITTIFKHSKTVSLFESWSDFLSYLTLKNEIPEEDFIILNSTALINKVIELIKNYDKIKPFFDNDEAGNKAFNSIQESTKKEVLDYRIYYPEHNDLNDYLINRKSEQV